MFFENAVNRNCIFFNDENAKNIKKQVAKVDIQTKKGQPILTHGLYKKRTCQILTGSHLPNHKISKQLLLRSGFETKHLLLNPKQPVFLFRKK